MNTRSSVPMRSAEKALEFSLMIGRASVIYAAERFTVYITVKNISDEPLYIWNFGIAGSSEFYFERFENISGPPKEKATAKLERFILYILTLRSRFSIIYTDYYKRYFGPYPVQAELSDEEVYEKSKRDMLKEWYLGGIKRGDPAPWKLSPGEPATDGLIGETRGGFLGSLFFRPDTYKLTLYVDYSNEEQEFFRDTKVEEVNILAPISSIFFGAVIGGLLGTLVRIFVAQDVQDIVDILRWRSLFEIVGTGILSVLAVIALARKTGAQTLVTIQDFWGGVLVGFLVGYSGKGFFDKLIGIT